MGTPSIGKSVLFGAGAANPVTNQFEILSPCTIKKVGSHVESDGMRGTRSHNADGVNEGPYDVGGLVPMALRPDTADFWWPLILGGTKQGNGTISPAETLTENYVTIDKVVKVYTYAGMLVNTAELACESRQNLLLTMDLQGKTETAGDAGSFPAISSTLSVLQPYIFHQGVFTLGSTPYEIQRFTLRIDNRLNLARHMNSQSRTALPATDRIITLQTGNPFTTSEIGLYPTAVAGLAATLVFTNGVRSMTLTFANLKVPEVGPEVSGREEEIMLPLQWTAYMSGATPELVVTNDST